MGRKFWLVGALLCSIAIAQGQKTDSLVHKLDSLSKKTDSAGGQKNNISPNAYNERTQLDFKTYFILLGSDLKQGFTKPFHMTKKDWVKFGRFTVGAVALGFADEPFQRMGLEFGQNNPRMYNISHYVTNFGGLYEAYTLGGLGLYGFLFKNEKMKTSTLLASQAYITGAALESVMKTISGRTRPSTYAPSVEAEPTFRGPFAKSGNTFGGSRINSSFPSGHTTVAFAAATVYALEYKNRPLIRILAYSAATLIGVSRITENKHWATDVFVGAALGLVTGRQVVNNYHRFAKIQAPKQKGNTVAFNMQYHFGKVMPGMVYTFK